MKVFLPSSFDYSSFDYSSFNYSSFECSSFDYSSFDCSPFDCSLFDCSSFDYSSFDCSSFECSSFGCSSFNYSSFDCSLFDCSPFDYSSFDCSSFECSSFDYSSFDYSSFECSSFDYPSFDRTMPKIILKKKDEVLRIKIFDQPEISVGQHTKNDIVVEDKSVSLYHCVIKRTQAGFLVEDCKSAFGTYLNGKKISKPVLLKDGDEINLGEFTLSVRFSKEEIAIFESEETTVTTEIPKVISTKDETIAVSLEYPSKTTDKDDATVAVDLEDKKKYIEMQAEEETAITEVRVEEKETEDDRTVTIDIEPKAKKQIPIIAPEEDQTVAIDSDKKQISLKKTVEEVEEDDRTIAIEDVESKKESPLQPVEDESAEADKTEIATYKREIKKEVEEEYEEDEEDTGLYYTGTPYYLLGISGPYFGKRYELKPSITKIGRSAEYNDIVLDKDPSISRIHARISYKNGEFVVSDKRSKTRTYVNNIKLSEDAEVPLKPKDEIEIASLKAINSTIFRFVQEGDWDFSPPKKAGIFFVRYKYYIFRIFIALLIISAIIVGYPALQVIDIVQQVPKPLKIDGGLLDSSGIESDSLELQSERLPVIPSAALGDVNSDGHNELIYIKDGTELRCEKFNKNRQLQSVWKSGINISATNIKEGIDNPSSPILADVSNKGTLDIIVNSGDTRVFIIDGKLGEKGIEHSDPLGGFLSSTPAVADLDGNGIRDLIITNEDAVEIADLEASVSNVHIGYSRLTGREWTGIGVGNTNVKLFSSPTIADINMDNTPEVIIGGNDGKIYIFNGKDVTKKPEIINLNEELNKARNKFEFHTIRSAIAVGRVNSDSLPDIVATTMLNSVVVFDGKPPYKLLWEYEDKLTRIPPSRHPAPVLADLDNDGKLDVIVCSLNGTVNAFKGEGSRKRADTLWTYTVSRKANIVATPALADFNKDKILDVVVSVCDGHIYILNGNPLSKKRLLWKSKYLGAPITSSPVVGDVDNDGDLDIALFNNKYQLAVFNSNTRCLKGQVVWGMVFGNSLHTSAFPYKVNITTEYIVCTISLIVILISGSGYFWNNLQRKKKIHVGMKK